MKFFKVPFDVLIMRYYLLMFVVIASFIIDTPILGLLALPIFLSAMLGVSFNTKSKTSSEAKAETEKVYSLTSFESRKTA